jgi:hypothetical protein
MTPETVYFHGQRYDTETLNGMTSGQLVALYNMLVAAKGSSKTTTRFESKATAIVRVWNALQAYAAEVVVADAMENPDTTPNSNIARSADPETGTFDVPALDDDGIALRELKEKSAELGKQIKSVKKAAAVAAKPASKVERLLEMLRSLPDGADIVALSATLGCDAKRVRGLIDSARSRGTRIVKVDGVKSTWRLA